MREIIRNGLYTAAVGGSLLVGMGVGQLFFAGPASAATPAQPVVQRFEVEPFGGTPKFIDCPVVNGVQQEAVNGHAMEKHGDLVIFEQWADRDADGRAIGIAMTGLAGPEGGVLQVVLNCR